jgi:glutathione-dependent peroxiredoxin
MTQPRSREGQPVPKVKFRYRENGEWKETDTDKLFKGRTVAVFSLPGAFTPTCSSTHLPRFNELAPTFKQNGVDQVICISVNDPYVMEEWAKNQEAHNVLVLPDGNGAFTEQMGMMVEKTEDNMGKRSWRYSMLVRDGIIEKMFIEPDEPGDPFKVSDADTLLKHVNGTAKLPDQIALLTREGCAYCAKAKKQLKDAGVEFAEVELPHTIRTRALGAIAKAKTVPQLFVNGELVGGSEAVEEWVARRRR